MFNTLFKFKTGNNDLNVDVSGIDLEKVPQHIAIIMDGNGRWAKAQGKPRTFGHQAGAETLKNIVKTADKIGVKIISAYAFSTENWKRPKTEVQFLMKLFSKYLVEQLRDLVKDNVQLHIIGDCSVLPAKLRQEIAVCESDTRNNDGLILNVAINYGGRQEIFRAVKSIAGEVRDRQLSVEDITMDTVTGHLYPSSSMDVDLMIRTGGESRISNFLLWQVSWRIVFHTYALARLYGRRVQKGCGMVQSSGSPVWRLVGGI